MNETVTETGTETETCEFGVVMVKTVIGLNRDTEYGAGI